MSYRFAAWSLPHLAVDPHTPIVDQLPVQDWAFEDQRENIKATINLSIPTGEGSLLNSIFFINPDDRTVDVGSIIHVYREGVEDALGNPAPCISYLLERRPDRVEEEATEVTELQGTHILSFFEHARVRAWDYPITPSVEIDWMYGADSILDNGDFDSGGVGNEIQHIWLDSDVTGGTWEATFQGDTADNLAWDITSSTLQTELQSSFNTMIGISVSGSGTEESPFLVEFTDPGGTNVPQMTLNGSGLTGGGIHVDTVQQGGEPSVSPWTKSTGLPSSITFGEYASDGFRIDTAVSRSGDYSLRINGLTQFAGAQQIVQVIPGMRYRASIWMYTTSAVDRFRLVIRDRFEALVAHSTPFEDTGTANNWKEFTCEFVAPSWTNLLIFRFAYVGTGNPAPFWLDDASLSPGAPASTMGEIWLELLADIQVDHAADWRQSFLTFITPTFTGALDSAGNAWPGDHQLTINEGNTYGQLMEHHQSQYGYEFDLRYDPDDDEFYFDIFIPGAKGTSHPTEFPAIVIGAGVTGGETVRSAPLGTSVFVRGSEGRWFEGIRSDARFAWGRREQFISATDAHDYFDLTRIHNQELERLELDAIGLQYKIADNAQSVPILHYRAGDYITVTPGTDTAIPSGSRRIETIKVSGRGGEVRDIDVHVQNEVYGSLGLAAQAEAVRRLIRNMTFRQPETGGGVNFIGGGGGIPDVVIAAADTVFLDTADLLSQDFPSDDLMLAEAISMLPEEGGWIHFLAGTYEFASGVFLGYANTAYIRLTGAGIGITNLTVTAASSMESLLDIQGVGLETVSIEDMTINGTGGTQTQGCIGVSFAQNSDVYLDNLEIFGSSGAGIGGEDGIDMNRSANTWWITNCDIHNNNTGLALHGSVAYLDNCYIHDNTGDGFVAGVGTFYSIKGSHIHDNGGNGVSAGGGLLAGAEYLVEGNLIDYNGGHGVYLVGVIPPPSIIIGNIIRNNTGTSIIAPTGSVVWPNLIYDNGTDATTPEGSGGGVDPDDVPQTSPQIVTYALTGTLGITTGSMKFVAPKTGTIQGVRAAVGVAPTGADIIVDVNKNGGTIYTTQANRPVIAAGSMVGAETVPDVTALVDGDYLTADIDQIGSTVAGEDLTVMIDVAWDLTPGA